MISGPSNQGGGVDVDKDYDPAALPTICLIAPDKEVVEKDIWPANTILTTLQKYDFNPVPVDYDFQEHISYTKNLPEISIKAISNQKITFFASADGNYKLSVYSADGKVVIK